MIWLIVAIGVLAGAWVMMGCRLGEAIGTARELKAKVESHDEEWISPPDSTALNEVRALAAQVVLKSSIAGLVSRVDRHERILAALPGAISGADRARVVDALETLAEFYRPDSGVAG